MHKHKHKSKSKSHEWGPWSDWAWDAAQQAYVRVRQDTEGVHDYEWDQRSLSYTQTTPRDSAVEDITERLGSLSPGTHETLSDEYACVDRSSDRQKPSKQHSSKEKEKEKDKEREKAKDRGKDKNKDRDGDKKSDKDKERRKDRERDRDRDREREKNKEKGRDRGKDKENPVRREKEKERERGKEREKERTHRHRDDSDDKEAHNSPPEAAESVAYLQDYQYAQQVQAREYRQQVAPAHPDGVVYSETMGRGIRYANAPEHAESQYQESETAEGSAHPSRSYPTTTYPYAESSSAAAVRGLGAELAESYTMPQMEETQEAYHLSTAAVAHAAELDPRYRVEHSTKFQPGEIFKVFWPEPQGSASDNAKATSKGSEAQGKFGTNFFVGFRRFIVVANDQGHCTCIPILTYGGKGCKKHGVKPEKHGIIHERSQKAKKLDGEPSLGFHPVKAEMTEDGEKLARESRVNYSKLVTVEHNFLVFFIGRVQPSDWQIVLDAVDYCWGQKIRQSQRRR